ncbi:putative ribosomal protein L29e [Helianthus anomalus]
MAKSKNHTAHNQSYKANRNDIKKPRKHRHTSTKGVCVFLSFYLQFFLIWVFFIIYMLYDHTVSFVYIICVVTGWVDIKS